MTDNELIPEPKHIVTSKTAIVNVLAPLAVVAANRLGVDGVGDGVAMVSIGWGALNILIRIFTRVGVRVRARRAKRRAESGFR